MDRITEMTAIVEILEITQPLVIDDNFLFLQYGDNQYKIYQKYFDNDNLVALR